MGEVFEPRLQVANFPLLFGRGVSDENTPAIKKIEQPWQRAKLAFQGKGWRMRPRGLPSELRCS